MKPKHEVRGSEGTKRHKHVWGRQFRGVFNGPMRWCACGALMFATGRIMQIVPIKRRKKKQESGT